MNPRSIQQLAQWRDEAVRKIDADVYFPIVVVGNKLDLRLEKAPSLKLPSPTGSNNYQIHSPTNSSSAADADGSDDDATWTESSTSREMKPDTPRSVGLPSSSDDHEDADCKDSQLTVLQWCRNNSYGHLETSAKDDIGIETAMQTIAALALEAYKTNPRNEESSKKVNPSSKKINLDDLYAPKSKSACDACVI